MPPLLVSFFHSYDAPNFRCAPPLYEHLSVKSISLSVSQTWAFMCPPVCFCVPTTVHFCILPLVCFYGPSGTLGLWVGLGCPLTATVLWFFTFQYAVGIHLHQNRFHIENFHIFLWNSFSRLSFSVSVMLVLTLSQNTCAIYYGYIWVILIRIIVFNI